MFNSNKIEGLERELSSIKDRLVMLECNHEPYNKIFYIGSDGYQSCYGYTWCSFCKKKLKIYYDEIEYKRDYIKHLQDRLDIENKSLNKKIASQKGE